jgi:hypothetical protein
MALAMRKMRSLACSQYERGWPRYYNIPARKKNVDVRDVQIYLYKLAANSSDCGLRIFVTFTLHCVAKVLRLARREKKFYEHPEKMRKLHIKLQECTVIAIYFSRALS